MKMCDFVEQLLGTDAWKHPLFPLHLLGFTIILGNVL